MVLESATPASPQIQRPDFQVFSFFPTVRPEEERTGGGGGSPVETARSTTTPSSPDAGRTSLTARVKRPEVVRPGGSTRTQDEQQEAQAGTAGSLEGRFLPSERITPRPTQQHASQQPPAAFQDLFDENNEEGELFIFQRPEADESNQPTMETVSGFVNALLNHQAQESEQVHHSNQAEPSKAQNRNFNLDDMFVFKPNNRTPLSRLIQNYDDFADETVGRITVLGQSNGLKDDVPDLGQPTFSFFPAVTPNPVSFAVPPTLSTQEIFQPPDAQLLFTGPPLRSIDNNFILSGSEGGQLIDFKSGQEVNDLGLGSQLVGLGSSGSGESRPLSGLVSSFVEDHRDNFAIVRASTNLTPDLASTEVLVTTTPRYFHLHFIKFN